MIFRLTDKVILKLKIYFIYWALMLKYEKELEHEANEDEEWRQTNKHSKLSRKATTYETRVARRYSGNFFFKLPCHRKGRVWWTILRTRRYTYVK